MSIQQVNSQEKFEVNDGEVNIECDEDSQSSLQESSKDKPFFSTNYATYSSNLVQIEGLNREIPASGNQIHQNLDEFENQRGEQVLDFFEEDDDVHDLFNQSADSITVTALRIIEQVPSYSTPSEDTIQSQASLPLQKEGSDRNDSKNVPKGMMKAFAHMVLDKDPQIVKILADYFDSAGESYEQFKDRMRTIRKSSKISISEIRSLLIEGEFACTMRKLGCYFLRKRFLNHIFNSKMEKRHIHLKYIPKWIEIFKNPSEFTSLK